MGIQRVTIAPERETASRTSEPAQRQRDGAKSTGAFGQHTGESDLLFVEGQLPERDGTIAGDESASRRLELCLENLESVLATNGRTSDDILQLTLYSQIWMPTSK